MIFLNQYNPSPVTANSIDFQLNQVFLYYVMTDYLCEH